MVNKQQFTCFHAFWNKCYRKKSSRISAECSSCDLLPLIFEYLILFRSLMAHVYCVEWKIKKFQESVVGQFLEKFWSCHTSTCYVDYHYTMYCSVFKNIFLFSPLQCFIGSQFIRIIFQNSYTEFIDSILSNFSHDLCKVLLFRVFRNRILLLKIAFTYCYHYYYLCYLVYQVL